MSDEVQQKGCRIPYYVRPAGSNVAQPEDRIYRPGDVQPEIEESLRDVVIQPGFLSAHREDMQMLFRGIMQFARYLAKKYGFTIKQWPEK